MTRHPALLLAVLIVSLVAAGLFAPRIAHAAVQCGSLNMTAAFGSVNPNQNVNKETTTTIAQVLQCRAYQVTQPVGLTLCLNLGSGPYGLDSSNNRQMRNSNGVDKTPFQMYTSASRSVIWGGQSSMWPGQWLATSVTLPADSAWVNIPFIAYATLFLPQAGKAAGPYFAGVPISVTGQAVTGGAPPTAETACLQSPNFPAPSVLAGVSVTFDTNANFLSATPLDFGTVIGLFRSNRDKSSLVSFACSVGHSYTVTLDNGQHYAGGSRRMESSNGDDVSYGLYRDSSRTEPWGTATGQTVNGTCTGKSQNLTVYGRVPSQPPQPVGNYSDTVTVTLSY